MKLFYKGDGFAQKVLGSKTLADGIAYRWSNYAIFHECDGERYLYHNLTKKLYQLEDEGFDVQRTARFSAEQIAADENLTQLVNERFIVPENSNESAVYEGFCKIARAMKMKKQGYTSFTILPTTACNARCVYCFEQGMKYVTMTDETVQQTIDFIKKVRNPQKPVVFSWFGGEPLIGKNIIDKICSGMREAEIPYTSRMISNGSLIENDLVQKMKEDWHLKTVQITLDGVEEEYNRRKNYYFNYESAYWHVLARIKMLNVNDVTVAIRINIDKENIDGVLTMIDDLKNFIVKPELVFFDLAPLFDLQESTEGITVWEKSFKIIDEIGKQGYHVAPHYSVNSAKYHFCMADAPYMALVISPEGKLYNCEHIEAAYCLGDIWDGVTNTNAVKRLAAVEPAQEQCRGCFSLPNCTTFSGCDTVRVDCRYAETKRLNRALNQFIRNIKSKKAEKEKDEEKDEEENSELPLENC